MGLIDFISFDPVDSMNRPFWFKNINFKEYEKLKKKTNYDVFKNNQNAAKWDFTNVSIKAVN